MRLGSETETLACGPAAIAASIASTAAFNSALAAQASPHAVSLALSRSRSTPAPGGVAHLGLDHAQLAVRADQIGVGLGRLFEISLAFFQSFSPIADRPAR